MIEFLDELMASLGKIDPDGQLLQPMPPPKEGDEVVGVMNEGERRLALLIDQEVKAANVLISKYGHMQVDAEARREEMSTEAQELSDEIDWRRWKVNHLHQVLFTAIKHRLPPTRTKSFAFREGWKVALTPAPSPIARFMEEGLLDFLMKNLPPFPPHK